MILKSLFKDYKGDYVPKEEDLVESAEDNRGKSYMEEILKKYLDDGYKILDYGYDIYGHIYYAVSINGYIYLVDQTHSILNSPARLFYKIQYESKFERNIYLEDIQFGLDDVNKGYGSILINALKKLAKEYEAEKIYGELSFVDEDSEEHISRRRHFYEKHGFSITNRRIELLL